MRKALKRVSNDKKTKLRRSGRFLFREIYFRTDNHFDYFLPWVQVDAFRFVLDTASAEPGALYLRGFILALLQFFMDKDGSLPSKHIFGGKKRI